MENSAPTGRPRRPHFRHVAGALPTLGPLTRHLSVPTALLVTFTCWSSPCAASEPEAAPPQAALHQESPETPLPPPPTGSGGIAVFPIAGTNLSDGETAALGVLMASELRAAGRERVIGPEQARMYSTDSADRKATAAYMKVEQYLQVEAVRLERTTFVTATLYDQDGGVASSAKMTAASVDDFQYVSERLVIALLEGKPVEKTRTLDNITEQEAEPINRTFVEKIFGFKTGFIVPYTPQFELPPMVAITFDARLEGKNYFLEFGAGLLVSDDSDRGGYGGVFTDIGGNFYLSHTNTSPYLGAGIMPRILSTKPTNLAAYGQAGLMFFRTSSTRLYLELRVAQNLNQMESQRRAEDDPDSYPSYETVTYRPLEFGANLGLGW